MTHRQMATKACFPFGFGFLCVNARFINEVLCYMYMLNQNNYIYF